MVSIVVNIVFFWILGLTATVHPVKKSPPPTSEIKVKMKNDQVPTPVPVEHKEPAVTNRPSS